MDTYNQKIEKWSSKLLDLSKRNRLLNYKIRKKGSLLLKEEITNLWEKLLSDGVDFSVSNDLEQLNENEDGKVIENIRKLENSHFSEFGFHISYITFGQLVWKEFENTKPFLSPLILIPVEVVQIVKGKDYKFKYREDEDIQVNPVLVKKIKDDFDINFDFLLRNIDLNNSDIKIILDIITKEAKSLGWEVNCNTILDNFNFQNFVIYKDLEKNKELFKKNKFIKLLTNQSSSSDILDSYNEDINLNILKSESHLQILDADSSQQEAIVRARRGDSFVLQGPPGTQVLEKVKQLQI